MGIPQSRRNRDKTNIETKSFILKNICDSEKYIPTTKYVTIIPPMLHHKKCKKNISEPLIFKGDLRPK